jgi:tRNA(Ile)-lysidine synthase
VSDALVAVAADRLARLAPVNRPVLLAVSGGPDSVAMLELLWRGRSLHGRDLVVGHVDHGITPASGAVAERVVALARERGLPCEVRHLSLGAPTTETAARGARRAALRAMASDVGAARIALAHHADDQVETVLLRVLRGSGMAGLAAMAPRRGPWIRPLLALGRDELSRFMEREGLSAWQDPANLDTRHLRSWLRIAVLPLLEERLSDLRPRLLALADHGASDRRAWNAIPALLPALDLRDDDGRLSVAAAPLRGYRSEVQHAVVAALGRRFGVPLGSRHVARVRQLLESGQSGRRVALARGLEAEVAFDRLILRRPEGPPFAAVELPRAGALAVGAHQLRVAMRPAPAEGPSRRGTSADLGAGRYRVRPWRAGDRIRPLGGTGSRPVVVLFREAKVAAGRRPAWPVVVSVEDDATIVWVPGICRSGDRIPAPGEESLHVECDLA